MFFFPEEGSPGKEAAGCRRCLLTVGSPFLFLALGAQVADKLPWFPFYGRDFFEDEHVQLMSNAQIGMYLRLLQFQWIEGSIPSSIASSSAMGLRHASYDEAQAKTEFATVMAMCFTEHSPGRIYNQRLDDVRRQQLNEMERKRAGGLATAQLKESRRRAASLPGENQNQNQSQSQSQNQKKEKMKSVDELKIIAPTARKLAALPDGEWLEALKKQERYKGLDIDNEFKKAGSWAEAHQRNLTRKFFQGTWLVKALNDRPMEKPTSKGYVRRPVVI